MNDTFPWIILFLPLAASVLITLFTQKRHGLSAALSVGAIVIAFGLSLAAFSQATSLPVDHKFTWLNVGDLNIDFGYRLDQLSLLMLLIVTGVGSMIHIYSIGYMHGDPAYSRFFACLSFFTFSMLGIVLSDNFFQMFIFWELVGVSSYMLIGFWYQKPSAADAAKKAFLSNRLGDFGFLLGIIMIWVCTQNLGFDKLPTPDAFGPAATVVGLLIFCGAVGKSAQFPLHVWLPDAMEGPTPVSALIHAATMVAAGVFMLSRVFVVFNADALTVIAWIGGITSLMAALIAVQQNDIKRILAYSTLSQLGYMVMAVGVSAPAQGMFHLTTHAFFKALLFLGAGSVIHAMTNEQDIWKMGGLIKKMPVTFWTFLAGTLALCGVIPLSGFYSKDSILAAAFESHNMALFAIGVFVAVLTTFYMFRLFFVVFLGGEKTHAAGHAHESPKVMILPLVALAIPSVIGGFMGIEQFVGKLFHAEELPLFDPFGPFKHAPVAASAGLAAVVIGFLAAWKIYAKAASDPLPAKLGVVSTLMRNKFYFDELYTKLIACTQDALAKAAAFIDRWIIGGAMVRGTQGATELAGRALRFVQMGNIQVYAFLFAAGILALLLFVTIH